MTVTDAPKITEPRIVSDRSCPRRLAGRRCADLTCWCASRLNDHGRTWLEPDGTRTVRWEPYDCCGLDLAEIVAAPAADGLAVYVTGGSRWNPGACFAIVFQQPDAATRLPSRRRLYADAVREAAS